MPSALICATAPSMSVSGASLSIETTKSASFDCASRSPRGAARRGEAPWKRARAFERRCAALTSGKNRASLGSAAPSAARGARPVASAWSLRAHSRIADARRVAPSDAPPRRGCGLLKSCAGVWPNESICASTARRCRSSAIASTSTAPSYVRWWNSLFARSAAAPRCLQPKTKSTQWCRRFETWSDSRAARCRSTKAHGSPFAHAGSPTLLTTMPS